MSESHLERWQHLNPDPVLRAVLVESELQSVIRRTLEVMEEEDRLTDGLENFLQDLADKHETHQYLLGRRSTGIQRIASRWLERKA